VQLDKTTETALRVLHLAGLGTVPVVAGQASPLLRPGRAYAEDGSTAPEPYDRLPPAKAQPLDAKAVNAMYTYISRAHKEWGGGRVALVATGALTNIAMLIKVFPEVLPLVEIVFTGGSMGAGHTGLVAESNIRADPEAADIVFKHGAVPVDSHTALPPNRAPITMVPFEVTQTVSLTQEVLDRIRSPTPTRLRSLLASLLASYTHSVQKLCRLKDPPLQDPCAVALVAASALFDTVQLCVDVETQSKLSAGQTVCDVWGSSGRPVNVSVVTRMNVDAFWDVMLGAISRADAKTPLNHVHISHPLGIPRLGTPPSLGATPVEADLQIAHSPLGQTGLYASLPTNAILHNRYVLMSS
jgi:inosine-uridine nucleoside N-ribohydrolase